MEQEQLKLDFDNMTCKVIYIFIFISLYSCGSLGSRTGLQYKLGGNYLFISEGGENCFIVKEDASMKNSEEIIIPPFIKKYNYDKNYIIALTVKPFTTEKLYWIIDKKNNKTHGPVDSLEFNYYLINNNIKLQLK